jgi:hypothetical protein
MSEKTSVLVGRVGIEPTTKRLRASRPTKKPAISRQSDGELSKTISDSSPLYPNRHGSLDGTNAGTHGVLVNRKGKPLYQLPIPSFVREAIKKSNDVIGFNRDDGSDHWFLNGVEVSPT